MSRKMFSKLSLVMLAVGVGLILVAQFLYLNQKLEKIETSFIQANISSLSDEVLSNKIDEGIENFIKKEMEKQEEAMKAETPEDLSPEEMLLLMDDDAVKGSKDAAITIVEFSEYQCPYCKMYFENTYQQLLKEYVETGKVKYVFRDYPLDFHPEAYPAALAAECVRDQKGDESYFLMHDKLFENQETLSTANYEKWADELGANKAKFKECFDSDKFKDEILKDLTDGKNVGVRGTPAFFVNGRFISGAVPFEYFEAMIEEELAKL
jgi:protein-disulfide isomerase